jgi:hypothetical protein
MANQIISMNKLKHRLGLLVEGQSNARSASFYRFPEIRLSYVFEHKVGDISI